MSNKDEARISGFIRCQIEVERPLTRAELNVRRVIGLTVIAALIGGIWGYFIPLNPIPPKCQSGCYPDYENCPKDCPLG